jgi:hypothetical protein
MADVQAPVVRCQIDRLTVVAGPKGVGKSWFIRRLAKNESLRERLGVPRFARAISASQVDSSPLAGSFEHVVLHYDILRRCGRAGPEYDRDDAMRILGCATSITFLTLRTSPERLRLQLERKVRKRATHRWLEQLRERYSDERFLESSYERWFDFIARYQAVTVGSWLVDAADDFAVSPLAAGSSARTPAAPPGVTSR